MRVLIDATSILLRSAGIKSYTWHWVHSLRAIAGPEQIRAFPFLGDLGPLDHERSDLSPLATYPRLALLYLANMPRSGVVDWVARGADMFHMSNQVRVPPKRTRITATLHDLTCWLTPELHTAGNVRADKSFAHDVLQRAVGLIAVSEHTRQDAIRILGLAPERIVTIHSGVPDAYFDAKPPAAKRPYVLFVGTIEPRKNLDTLLDAWTGSPLHNDFDLVIAGATGWSAERTVARLRSGIPGVRYVQYVPEAELPSLMAGATVFVYPSLYEGFGFPVAQAMAARVPVLTSNVSSLPEVAGDGAFCVDPRSAAELRTALTDLLTSPSKRQRLASNGAARAQNYRWNECARKSLDFFRGVCG